MLKLIFRENMSKIKIPLEKKGYVIQGTLTIFFVRRVPRYANFVPDKKKWLLVVVFFSDIVLSSPFTVSFLFSLLLVQIGKRNFCPRKMNLYTVACSDYSVSMHCRLLQVMYQAKTLSSE